MHFNNGFSAGCERHFSVVVVLVVVVNYGLKKESVINLITFSLILTSQHNLPTHLPSNSNIYS